jgi:hypothetical protein
MRRDDRSLGPVANAMRPVRRIARAQRPERAPVEHDRLQSRMAAESGRYRCGLLWFDYEHDMRSVCADFDTMRRIKPVGRIPSLVLDETLGVFSGSTAPVDDRRTIGKI